MHQQQGFDSDEAIDRHMCIRLWTSGEKLNGREFCSILNEAIRLDDKMVIRHVLTISRGIACLCVVDRTVRSHVKWPKDNKCYRGSGLPDSKRAFYQVGTHYRAPMYLATSLTRGVAQGFLNSVRPPLRPVLWTIHFSNDRCVHVNYISPKLSLYADEEEFLFVPYSTFTVREVKWKKNPTWTMPDEVHLDASPDNGQEPEDLPLAPWC